MGTQMKSLVRVVLCVVVSACSGTFPVEHVVVGDSIHELESGGETPSGPSRPRIDAEVVVSIRVPPEGLLLANSSEDINHFDSIRYTSTDLQGAERDAFFQALYRGLADSQGANTVLQIVDMEFALIAALQRHLERHFRSVRLSVFPDRTLAQPGSFVVGANGHANLLLTKSATVTLITEAGPVLLPPFAARGERRTGPHLGWAIPVALIAGVIVGLLVVAPILRAISRRHVRESWALAFDDVASQWASALADAWRENAAATPAR